MFPEYMEVLRYPVRESAWDTYLVLQGKEKQTLHRAGDAWCTPVRGVGVGNGIVLPLTIMCAFYPFIGLIR